MIALLKGRAEPCSVLEGSSSCHGTEWARSRITEEMPLVAFCFVPECLHVAKLFKQCVSQKLCERGHKPSRVR